MTQKNLTSSPRIRAVTMARKSLVAVGVVSMVAILGACSSEDGSAAFCEKWRAVSEDVASGKIGSNEDLLVAVSASNLGDPGGELSEYRAGFEDALRAGNTDGGALYLDLINLTCEDVAG